MRNLQLKGYLKDGSRSLLYQTDQAVKEEIQSVLSVCLLAFYSTLKVLSCHFLLQFFIDPQSEYIFPSFRAASRYVETGDIGHYARKFKESDTEDNDSGNGKNVVSYFLPSLVLYS